MLGFALIFFSASSPAEATSITIQNVTVTSTVGTDTRTWCMIGCVLNSGAGNLWAAYANTVINSPSSGGEPGIGFDTESHCNRECHRRASAAPRQLIHTTPSPVTLLSACASRIPHSLAVSGAEATLHEADGGRAAQKVDQTPLGK